MDYETGAGVSARATVLDRPRGERALIWAGFPLVGVAAGWLLPRAVDRATALEWLPLPGWVELIAAIPMLPAMIGGVVLGLIAGVVLVLISESEFVTVTVDDERIAAAGRSVDRGRVVAVFCDGKDLVVLGADTGELLRARGELPSGPRLRRAVEHHGYPQCRSVRGSVGGAIPGVGVVIQAQPL